MPDWIWKVTETNERCHQQGTSDGPSWRRESISYSRWAKQLAHEFTIHNLFFFFFRLSLRPDTLLRIIEHIWAYDLKSINIFSLTQTHTPSSFKPQLSSFVSHITFIVDLGCCIWKVKCSRHDDSSGRMYGEQMGCGVNVFVFVLFEDFYTVWISWWHFHTKRPYWCVCLSSWHEPTTTGTNCS